MNVFTAHRATLHMHLDTNVDNRHKYRQQTQIQILIQIQNRHKYRDSHDECIHGSPRYVTYALRYKYRQQIQIHTTDTITDTNADTKHIQIQSLPK